MATDYNLRNIRTLLTEGFTDEDLRRLCYDVADFRPVYDQLARSSGKAEIIDRLLEYADQNLQIDNLLCLAEKHNPARYEKHQPYYNSVITSSSKPKPLEPERQKRPVLSVVIAVIGVFAACVATIIGPLFVRWFYPSPIPPTNTLLTPVAILLTDTPVPSYIIPPTNTPLLPTNMPTLMNKPINTPLPTNTPIVTVRPFTVADAERVPLNSDCSYNVPDYFLVWEESSKYGRPDEMVTWDLTQFPQGIVIGDAVEAEIDGNGLGNPGKDVLFILESTNPVNRRILRLKSGNFFIVRPEDAEGVLRLRQRHLKCKWVGWRDITRYPVPEPIRTLTSTSEPTPEPLPTSTLTFTPLPPTPIPPTNTPKPADTWTPTSVPPQNPNLITINSNFEDGFTGWQYDLPHTNGIYTDVGYNGKAICSRQNLQGNEPKEWVGIQYFTLFPVSPGQKYRFSGWLKWENVTKFHVKIIWNNDIANWSAPFPTVDGSSNGWIAKEGTITVPQGVNTARLAFWHGVRDNINVPGGVFCVDDVSFSLVQ